LGQFEGNNSGRCSTNGGDALTGVGDGDKGDDDKGDDGEDGDSSSSSKEFGASCMISASTIPLAAINTSMPGHHQSFQAKIANPISHTAP
jgi:hypothetical protein